MRSCYNARAAQQALQHGTLAWQQPRWEPRSLLFKYCPHYMMFADEPSDYSGCPCKAALSGQQERLLHDAFLWERPNL